MKSKSLFLLSILSAFTFGIASTVDISDVKFSDNKIIVSYNKEKGTSKFEATDSGPLALCVINRLLKHKYSNNRINKISDPIRTSIEDSDLAILAKSAKLVTPKETADKLLQAIKKYKTDKSKTNDKELFNVLAESISSSMPESHLTSYLETFQEPSDKAQELIEKRDKLVISLEALKSISKLSSETSATIKVLTKQISDLDDQIKKEPLVTKHKTGKANPTRYSICLEGEDSAQMPNISNSTKTDSLLSEISKGLDKLPTPKEQTPMPHESKKETAPLPRKSNDTAETEKSAEPTNKHKPAPVDLKQAETRPKSEDLSPKKLITLVDDIEKKAQHAGIKDYKNKLKELSDAALADKSYTENDVKHLKEIFDLRFNKTGSELLTEAKKPAPYARDIADALKNDSRVKFLVHNFPLSEENAILFLRAVETGPKEAGTALGELVYSLDDSQRKDLIAAIKKIPKEDPNSLLKTYLDWIVVKEEGKQHDKDALPEFVKAYDARVINKIQDSADYWKKVDALEKNAAEIKAAAPEKVEALTTARSEMQKDLTPYEDTTAAFARFNIGETNKDNINNALTNGSRSALASAAVASDGKAWLNLAPKGIGEDSTKAERLYLGNVKTEDPTEILKTASGALSNFNTEKNLNRYAVERRTADAPTAGATSYFAGNDGIIKMGPPRPEDKVAKTEFKPNFSPARVPASPEPKTPPTTPPPETKPTPKDSPIKTAPISKEDIITLGGSDGKSGVAGKCLTCHTVSSWSGGNFNKGKAGAVTKERFLEGLQDTNMLNGNPDKKTQGLKSLSKTNKDALIKWAKSIGITDDELKPLK